MCRGARPLLLPAIGAVLMLLNPQDFSESCFVRQDPSDDALFYSVARKVVHIDEGAIKALTRFLSEQLSPGGNYLDLMSSWRSHLPSDLGGHVTGLGMNAEEMADNPQLDEWVVHNLNAEPQLPFADRHFDAVICTVSVQYMIQPLDIFRQVERVLKPSAPFIVSFSNRCFPQKATALWLATADAEHVELIRSYFGDGWDGVATRSYLPEHADPLLIVWANRSAG